MPYNIVRRKQFMELFKKKKLLPKTSAVIVAAGSSSRMGSIDKQMIDIDGMPVLIRTIKAFENSVLVNEIVVVTKEEKIPWLKKQLDIFGIEKVTNIVSGADTRQASVKRGVEACSENTDYYAIHDGARPLVSTGCIDICIEDAFEYEASFPAVPVKDTIKTMDKDGFVASTPDRSTLFVTQTPQVFKADIYNEALKKAVLEGKDYTDDCQLFESVGKRVHMVPGEYTNIKITTPEDIVLAEAIINSEV